MRQEADHPRSTLGRCPDCGSAIAAGSVLIEYERTDGQSAMFAECPACRDVVHPA